MGHHPMGEGVDPNPRIVAEKLVDPSALVMGQTAENLHDRFPHISKERADAFAVASQERLAAAYAAGRVQRDLVPVATRDADGGWGLATVDEPPRPGTTMADLADLRTPFRPHGHVTAGNAAGLNDGATACLLADEETARALGLNVGMRLVGYGIADDDERVNPWGGAIAVGHPLASSGVRLMTQLSRQFAERPDVRYGLTAMCIGIGMGGTVIWENPNWSGHASEERAK